MKRFVWRLQSVLDVKEKQEEKKRLQLFKITGRIAEKRSELLTEKRKLEDIFSAIAAQGPDERMHRQEFFLRFSAASDKKIKKLRANLRDLESEQRAKMAELIKVRKFKKSLEQLRENEKRKFIYRQEKLEQKELDDMAGIAFVRKKISVLKYNGAELKG